MLKFQQQQKGAAEETAKVKGHLIQEWNITCISDVRTINDNSDVCDIRDTHTISDTHDI